ncbi:hypothetical protein K439DRAFT_1628364 [Ramaria rubella]|nr:hypothetical protein K439DRAFT_1628364 [Ramaria rubella]
MRFITIASILVAAAHVAVSAPVCVKTSVVFILLIQVASHFIARRAQDGVGAVILMPASNGVVQCDDNEEQDLLVRGSSL